MKTLIPIIMILALSGCAHVVSEKLRKEADHKVYVKALFADPEAFKGETVILGGVIIAATNTDNETYIEVLERPLDDRGRPLRTETSRGRFIVFYEGYLETAIYARGRSVTVAGDVLGVEKRQLGKTRYSYPLIKGREVHLVKPGAGPSIRFGFGVFHSF